MDFLKDLNPEQRAAVTATEGQVRVIAGPGTGKTRTLTRRFCHLVSTLGIAPRNTLCATFTNRAAHEMKLRVRRALGDMDLGLVCTFHAFCVQLLRDEIHLLGYPRNFAILDTEDWKDILLKIFGDMGLSLRDATIKNTIDTVLEAGKMHASTYIEDILLLDNERIKARFAHAASRDEEIFLRYLYEQKKSFGCDFNDLINFATYILEHFPDARARWQERMQYVMVDEFQDVSARQFKLARLLSGGHGNLFVVGDPDQTIYTWRGSHYRLFLDFDKLYPHARTIALTANYRSTPQILAAASTLIARNLTRLPVFPEAVRASGAKARYFHAKSEKAEAAWIAEEIGRLRGSGVDPGDIAVLYRAHYLSRALEERFIEAGLAYRIYSGVEFYGRREIKDMVCYLRMVTAGDDIAFRRTINVPPRTMGKKRLERLAEYAGARGLSLYEALQENLDSELTRGTGARRYAHAVETVRGARSALSMGDAFQMLLDLSGYEEFLRLQGDQDRLDNAAELKRSVAAMGEDQDAGFEDFLARAALFSNIDREEDRATVRMMTVHAAKGMEFSHVFLCGLNEGVFPSRRIDTPEDMEEERRLAYVAMTRAKNMLYLSDAEGVAGDGLFKYPSRFIFEAGKEHLDYAAEPDGTLAAAVPDGGRAEPPPAQAMAACFAVGDPVNHPAFGPGKIVRVDFAAQAYVVAFDSLPTSRSIRFGAALTLGGPPDDPAVP
ncbi:MAG: UvrD-helicase domain-containing protein [Deltaproteobacteria bacterium]|jgi:DNA helicase-2/ATP-dependent DNA helicase PcrA|nr:UvrD-helicase domain-containing protein [Deltaproteobacteria bacterium]